MTVHDEEHTMTERPPTAACRRVGQVAVIDIRGDVTPAAEEALSQAHTACQDAAAVVLNLEGLAYMNSGGIGLLVTMLVRAQRQEQRLLAYGLSPHYRQIFSLTRLDDAIELFDAEDDALRAAGVQEEETRP